MGFDAGVGRRIRCIAEMSKWHKCKDQRLLAIWRSMIARCTNPNSANYVRYGGRGITVCDEWKDGDRFAEWALNNGYEVGLSIERIDNNGPYAPDNCRFATAKEQANNRRSNRIIEYHGEKKTLSEWADIAAVSYGTFCYRLSHGWAFEEALSVPENGIQKGNPVAQYSKDGKLVATYSSRREAARKTGILFQCICDACNGKLKTSGGYVWKLI